MGVEVGSHRIKLACSPPYLQPPVCFGDFGARGILPFWNPASIDVLDKVCVGFDCLLLEVSNSCVAQLGCKKIQYHVSIEENTLHNIKLETSAESCDIRAKNPAVNPSTNSNELIRTR